MTDRTGQPLRITQNTLAILRVLADADAPMWGVDITRGAKLHYGTGRPVIIRLVEHGWVQTTKEAPGTHRARPTRHLYQLTPDGRLQAKAVLQG